MYCSISGDIIKVCKLLFYFLKIKKYDQVKKKFSYFRFLERSQIVTLEKLEIPRHSYEGELVNLHDTVQQYVSSLLTDSQNIVKRTLIECGIVKLCIFFGKHKCTFLLKNFLYIHHIRRSNNAFLTFSTFLFRLANDVLLSHMITFLNDKIDKQLRGSFFDYISGVAGYVGVHCSPILTPLLQQVFYSKSN